MINRIAIPFATLMTFFASSVAFAAAPAGGEAAGGVGAIGYAAIAVGLAALGGSLGQGRAVAAALEGIARNPSSSDKVFTPMLLGLAFIESLVIFALVIAFMQM